MTLETRRSAEHHHTFAAHHHEQAARHHHEAAKHFQNDDHAHAAHQAQIAYAHTRRAIRHSDEAAEYYTEQHGRTSSNSKDTDIDQKNWADTGFAKF
jgi:hypothetical protein